MKPTSRSSVVLSLIASAGIVGCDALSRNGAGDPVAILADDTPSAEHDDAFWDRQRRENVGVWERAKAFCDDGDVNRHPNCRPVLSLMVLERTLERPPSTSPGFDGSLDFEERRDAAQRQLDSLSAPE